MNTVERFEERAVGADTLIVDVLKGDLYLETDEQWSLEWSSDRGEAPEVSRDGNQIHVRQPRREEYRHNPPRLDLRLRTPRVAIDARTGYGSIDARRLAERSALKTGNGSVLLSECAGDLNASSGNGEITIHQFNGSLHAHTGNGDIKADNLQGEATLDTGSGKIEVAHSEELQAHSGNGDLRIRSAHDDTDVSTGSGRIEIEDCDGMIRAHSGNGDLLIRGGQNEARLDTGSGRVEITDCHAERITCRSGNGDIRVQSSPVRELDLNTGSGTVSCALELEDGDHKIHSGNGDIQLSFARGRVRLDTGQGAIVVDSSDGMLAAHTGNGDIRLGEVRGETKVDTGSGRIEVRLPRELALKAHSGNGDIEVGDGTAHSMQLDTSSGKVLSSVDPLPGKHELHSGNGDIEMRLPAGIRARFDAQTGNGQILSDFPSVKVGRSGGAGGSRMVGSIGNGEPNVDLSLRTSSGHISLQRRAQSAGNPSDTRPQGLLRRPDYAPEPETGAVSNEDPQLSVLEAVARGDLSVEEADRLLSEQG